MRDDGSFERLPSSGSRPFPRPVEESSECLFEEKLNLDHGKVRTETVTTPFDEGSHKTVRLSRLEPREEAARPFRTKRRPSHHSLTLFFPSTLTSFSRHSQTQTSFAFYSAISSITISNAILVLLIIIPIPDSFPLFQSHAAVFSERLGASFRT